MIILTFLSLLAILLIAIKYSRIHQHFIEIIILIVSMCALYKYGLSTEKVFFLVTVSVFFGVASFLSSYDFVLGMPNSIKFHLKLYSVGGTILLAITYFSFASFFETLALLLAISLLSVFTRNVLLSSGNNTHMAIIYGTVLGYLSLVNGIVYYFYYFN